MENKIRYVIVMLIMLLLVQFGSAETFKALMDIDKASINNGTIVGWTSYEKDLWVEEDVTKELFNKIFITFTQPNTALTIASIEVKQDGQSVWITPGTGSGEYEIITNFGIKITLKSIKSSSTTDSIGATNSDDIVSVWLAPNAVDVLGLMRDGTNSFNPVEYGKTNGWSSTGSTEKVTLKVKRFDDKVGVLITVKGGEWEEKSVSGSGIRTYLLKNNAVYTITVEYDKLDVWSGETHKTDTYTLSIAGLSADGSTYTPTATGAEVLLGSFEATIGKWIVLETSVNGSAVDSADYTFKYDGQNSAGNYVWKTKFESEGAKRIDFVGDNGMKGYFNFVISAPQTVLDASQTTTSSSSDNNLGYIIMVIAAILVLVGIVIFSKKKGGKRGGMPDIGGIDA